MRSAPRLLWLGLVGLVLAGILRRRRSYASPPRLASPESHHPDDEPLINRPDRPRGDKTVVVVGLAATVVLAAGLTWYAADQIAENRAVALALTHGVAGRAPSLLTRYGCSGCHTVPGAPGADGKVGPDLADLRERVYVGGVLRNTPDNLIQWIVDPQRFSPQSAMPATGISESEARDVAAYLYAH
jgi:cytochrome c